MKDLFQFYLPVRLSFGAGKAETLGEETVKYGKKALIVTGRSSAKKSGLLDRAVKLLEREGVQADIFDEAEPNPLASTVRKGAEIARAKKSQVILGLGGGSIIDCAKGIAFSACNPGDVFEYIYGRKQGKRALPLILVPTTCGTGSEGNGFAVLTEDETRNKKALKSDLIFAKTAIIDPELMTTIPKRVLSAVGFDAFCHCMEAYLSKNGTRLTSALALEGIRLIAESLSLIYRGEANLRRWEELSLGSTIGGMVIGLAGTTAAHGLEHPASGLCNITHGRGLAALTPVVCYHSIGAAPGKFAEISRLLGGRDETDCVSRILQLLDSIDLKTTLSKEGIREEDLLWMTENAGKVSEGNLRNHPKLFSPEEILTIYQEAF